LRETKVLFNASQFPRPGPLPVTNAPSSNLLFNDSIQTGSSAANSAYHRLLNEKAQTVRSDQELVTAMIRRAIEEEEARVIQALQCVSRESASVYSNFGISLPQRSDLARMIEYDRQQQQQQQQQLLLQQQLLENSTSAVDIVASLRNMTPQNKAWLLSRIAQRASQNLSHEQENDVMNFLNRGGLSGNSAALDSLQETERIHSQIMSTALEGLLSTSQQQENTASVGPSISSVATIFDGINPLAYDNTLLHSLQH